MAILLCVAAGFLGVWLDSMLGIILLFFSGVGCIVFLFFLVQVIQTHVHWGSVYRRLRGSSAPKVREALADGQVFVKRVVPRAVVEIEPIEDEGPGYLFDCGPGKTLVLHGQRFWDVEPDEGLPSTEFEIVRTVRHDLWVGVFCYGQRLEPVKVIDSSACKEGSWRESERLVDADMIEFLDSIIGRREGNAG